MGTVPANCQGNLAKCWGVTCDGLASHTGGVAILLVASLLIFNFLAIDWFASICSSLPWKPGEHKSSLSAPITGLTSSLKTHRAGFVDSSSG